MQDQGNEAESQYHFSGKEDDGPVTTAHVTPNFRIFVSNSIK